MFIHKHAINFGAKLWKDFVNDMVKKRAQEVFIPGALPESTYVTRKMKIGFTYEERLKQALSMNGYLTSISGPSKIGKTVLCEKVIGLEHLVEVSGSDFKDEKNLWFQLGIKAGMPSEGEFTTDGNTGNAASETYVLTKDNVMEYYKQHDFVLLLDDFHYAEKKMQIYMAQQFKDAIRKGFKVIVASLPHRSDDAIRTNPDLQGRISIIDIDAWSKEELREIPIKGFGELGIRISEENIDRLVEESICSPQLMQLICLNICILEGSDEKIVNFVKDETIEKAFRFSTLNLDYEKIAYTIKQGKNPRGKGRKSYQTKNLGTLDLYGLILEAIAIDPPIVSVDFDGLMNRILLLVSGEEKPTAKSLKDYLQNLQEVLAEKGRSYEVIEWKDNVLYILESLFLFYLRWGRI